MFRCKVDLGNLPRAADKFDRAYEKSVDQMKRLLDQKAKQERREDRYQNRTGDLRSHTAASEIISSGDSDMVELRADMPYAVYVNARGLMRIDDLAAEAETELEYLFEGLALTI